MGLLVIFILFFTCICNPTSSQLMSTRHDQEAKCGTVDCGMGTCRETPAVLPGFACDCYSGWSRPQLGGWVVWPSCIVPNCSINYECGGEPPVPPSPPPPLFLPLVNFSLPCLFVLCGDGECVPSGNTYECQCHQGSANLLGLPIFACVQKCNLGADCSNLGLGPPATGPPPSPLKSSASPGTGLAGAPNCSRSYRALSWMMMLLAAMAVSWI
ncbi:uncharacterized protein LOC115737474 isoform X2 [Rhodamnia argentea]|uniref:Uncharacterized protein LOC115737474 isoform X2 n=1 Tax=Rhodamnia argentea TaxID=178133 RepID=A0A8B8NTE0_9MYRT|nr:uncharacterized protein LOC115737474 isoform X2 [Rhodamnia argentea]